MDLEKRLPQINILITVLIVGFLVLAFKNVVASNRSPKLEPPKEIRNKELSVKTPTPFPDSELKPLAAYQKLFASKRLFRPLIKKDAPQIKEKTIDDITRDYQVVGIVQQDNPEAIVKNRRTRQTLFVKSGGNLGQLKVEKVDDDSVVVSYNGKEKTLLIQ